jgi:diamine N-acetyltransferase
MLKMNDILLRAVEPEDVDFLLEIENDPGIWEVSNTLAPYSRFQIEQYALNAPNDVETNKQLRLIIEWHKSPDQTLPVGAVDLFEINFLHRRAGIGISILDQFQNRGFAATALELMKTYVKVQMQLHQLHCIISETNKASIHLFEKAGFINCGTYKQWMADRGKWKNALLYQLIFDEQ